LSAAASLALEPSRIRALFNTDKYTTTGHFILNLYVKDHGTNVAIDDRIAVKLYDGKTKFNFLNSQASHDDAWWLVMLEKAFAKMYVNYANLNIGYPGEAFRAMTNMPS